MGMIENKIDEIIEDSKEYMEIHDSFGWKINEDKLKASIISMIKELKPEEIALMKFPKFDLSGLKK
jgi:hypothetical protein